ncbi:MAG: hypothetical protein WAV73_04390 [Candidatus Moraniibacteriota bacterium]
MTQITVLYLDGATRFEFTAKDLNLQLISFGTSLWQEITCWRDSPKEFQLVMKGVRGFLSAEDGQFDFIIIGDCGDFSIRLAKLVPEQLKPKTIIIRHRIGEGAMAPYEAMGFEHFSTRRDLGASINRLLQMAHKVS